MLEEVYPKDILYVLVMGSTFVTCLKCVCVYIYSNLYDHESKLVLSAVLCMFLVCLS